MKITPAKAVLKTPLYFIQGISMEPFLSEGMIVEIDYDLTAQCGDVVVFYRGNDLIGHRVVHIKEQPSVTYEIKGDALGYSDGWLARSSIIGVATRLTIAGKTYSLNAPSVRFIHRLIVRYTYRKTRGYSMFIRLLATAYRVVLWMNASSSDH